MEVDQSPNKQNNCFANVPILKLDVRAGHLQRCVDCQACYFPIHFVCFKTKSCLDISLCYQTGEILSRDLVRFVENVLIN